MEWYSTILHLILTLEWNRNSESILVKRFILIVLVSYLCDDWVTSLLLVFQFINL